MSLSERKSGGDELPVSQSVVDSALAKAVVGDDASLRALLRAMSPSERDQFRRSLRKHKKKSEKPLSAGVEAAVKQSRTSDVNKLDVDDDDSTVDATLDRVKTIAAANYHHCNAGEDDASFKSVSDDEHCDSKDDDDDDDDDDDGGVDAINALSLAVVSAPQSPMKAYDASSKHSPSSPSTTTSSSSASAAKANLASHPTMPRIGPPKLLAVRLVVPTWRLPATLTADSFSFLTHSDLLNLRLVCKLFLHVIRADRRFESVHVRTMAPKKARRRRHVQFVPEGNQIHEVSKYDHELVDWIYGKPLRVRKSQSMCTMQ